MGIYNIINYVCQYCGKPTSSQTKILGNQTMQVYNLGDSIRHPDILILLKNACEHCGCKNAIRIADNEIVEIRKNGDDVILKESYWGSFEGD